MRKDDERGAVAIVMAAAVLVLVLIAAFAVDLGMQRVARRDMQSLADIVALDLVRELDGAHTVAQLTPLMPDLARQSRERNESTIGETPDLAVELGKLDTGGNFVVLSGTAIPTAVRVTSATSVGFAFVPGSGGAVRSAVAGLEAGACFNIGSYAARLDTSSSPILGALLGALGSNVALSALDYNGLATTDVRLVDLLSAELAAGTVNEVVKGNKLIGLGDFYLAAADALERQGGSAAQVFLLEQLAASVDDRQLNAGDLLALGTGADSGLDAALNLYDLVTAGAAAATGHHAIEIPQLGVNLGPVANVQSSLTVIEPLKLGCGRKNDIGASASSTQVELDLSAAAANVSVPGLLRTNVSLSGTVSAASADGQLTDVRCDPPGITVAVSDGLIDVDLRLEVEVSLKVLFAVIPVVRGPITITGSKASNGDAVINIVNDNYDVPTRVGNGNLGLPALDVDTSGLQLIGLPLGVTLGGVTNLLVAGLVNPLVQGLDSALLGPLLNSLGLDLSGADVFARPIPKCGEPALRG
jgi:uncharacterized membrane protein